MGDLVAESNVFIAEENQHEVLKPEAEAFIAGNEGEYASTFEGARETFEAEEGLDTSALLVPAVRFVVNAVLKILRHQEVNYQIPGEVEVRSLVANDVVRHILKNDSTYRVVEEGYSAAGLPLPEAQAGTPNPVNINSLSGLSTGVFVDSSALSGGALKLLRDWREPVPNETEVIQRSSGLLRLAQLKADDSPGIYLGLGVPYINIGNLRIEDTPKGPKVRLQPEVLKMLGYSGVWGDGCPAARIRSKSTQGTVLQEDWRMVVSYLVPANARVDNYHEGPLSRYSV